MTHEESENLAAFEAIGVISEEEARTLESHLAECPTCRSAQVEFRQAANLMALSLDPLPPPADSRRRILQTISRKTERELPPVTQISSRQRRYSPWLAAAATLFLVLWGWSEIRLRNERDRIEDISAQATQLAAKQQELEKANEKMKSQIASISAASTQTIGLAGQEVAPSSSARVFMDANGRRAFVFFHGLPPNPGDKSYQLWIIPKEAGAKPMGVGVFDADDKGEASIVVENLPVAKEIKALAVTLEPKGGLSAPSGKMVMAGGDL